MTQHPFRPMAAALEFERDVAEMNEWNVSCTGDDDCIICKEVMRLADMFVNRLRSDGNSIMSEKVN